jgi:hypothetical protein
LDPDPALQVNPVPDFLDQKLQFTYAQATAEAFSRQKRTSGTSKNEIY